MLLVVIHFGHELLLSPALAAEPAPLQDSPPGRYLEPPVLEDPPGVLLVSTFSRGEAGFSPSTPRAVHAFLPILAHHHPHPYPSPPGQGWALTER